MRTTGASIDRATADALKQRWSERLDALRETLGR